MGKLIKFPAHRVVYNNEPTRPELSEDEARHLLVYTSIGTSERLW